MANENSGDVTINKILLISDGGDEVDLTSMFKNVSIFEDIYSNGMSGFLNISETYNLPETFPIIGEETIEFEFTSYSKELTKDTVFTKSFRVNKITEYEISETTDKVTYIISFTSKPFIDNLSMRLTRSFGNENHTVLASDIVTRVCEKMLKIEPKNLFIEKTRFERNVICSNWTPFQLFNYLAESDILASSSETKDKESTFMFFEDRDGFKFVSWSTLIEDKLYIDKEIEQLSFEPKKQNNNVDIKTFRTAQVINYNIVNMSSTMDNTSNGVFSNRFIYHDIITKSLTVSNYDIGDTFLVCANLDENQSAQIKNKRPKSYKDSTSFIPHEYHQANDTKTKVKWRQKSKSRVSMFENYAIEAEVVGNTGHRLGNVLLCDIPSTRRKTNGSVERFEQMSGKYLVTKIRHVIGKQGYRQILELRKGAQKKVN